MKRNNRKAATALKVGFLGVGKMGEAILVSLIRAKAVSPANAFVCDAFPKRMEELRASLRVTPSDATGITAKCDVVFLAVKPQDMSALVASIPPENIKGPLYISIAAGRTLAWLEGLMPGARVVRVMPNLAVTAGLGASAFCIGANARKADAKLAARLLNCTGKAIQVAETQMDAVTALSGSGPAFISYVLQSMTDAGIALGLSEADATALGLQTLLGTATVLSAGKSSVADFIKAVTSAKGTTAAGLEVLDKSSLRTTMKRTLAAAARRSKELSKLP